ncbi:MAG: polysaccharide biosynthesis tyrosine autokinase [Flavobacteriaceae bacterium]
MEENSNYFGEHNTFSIREEFLRYFSFWPYFIISIIFFFSISKIYLRYVNYEYQSSAKIEIIDKSENSEMALPTAMTVFNRSMINLENEIGVLSSFSLHERAVRSLKSNIKYFFNGRIKSEQQHLSEWTDVNYINFDKPEYLDSIKSTKSYEIYFDNKNLQINTIDENDDLIKLYKFKGYSTTGTEHNLPFDISFDPKKLIGPSNSKRVIKISPIINTVESFRSSVQISEVGTSSDQLVLLLRHTNRVIADEYLNKLVSEFDRDGIVDRQLEHKRTMDFVDSRSDFLTLELEKIELNKQDFKEKNKITDIVSNASLNISQQYNYDSELFSAKSQNDLLKILKETLVNNNFELMPVNIGIENSNINNLINEYNLIVRKKNRFEVSAGENNLFIKDLEKQLKDYSLNILTSIDNYEKSLYLIIANLEKKEIEFENFYKNIPENEKILRSIDRELKVKESLFLLLLQKREEAAINFAVVRPSIKIIDIARSNKNSVFPNRSIITMASLVIGFLIPFIVLYIIFLTDTKIHTKQKLISLVDNIPLTGEIPYIDDKDSVKKILPPTSRSPLSESIRMIIANLNFVLFNDENNQKNNLILVTSSIKGEGKTIVSVNTASLLSRKFSKVLLIGADLRNPQIHKFLENTDRSSNGLSDYIYKDGYDWKDFVIKHDNLDILLSGTIPPNPTELLSSDKFARFIGEVKNKYDYVVIDSAPCLLVSDTFEISKYVDTTLYLVRSNYSDQKLSNFINECKNEKKLSNMNLIFNSVGESKAYGYQYGYKYGYQYGYNYGYGYGYSED